MWDEAQYLDKLLDWLAARKLIGIPIPQFNSNLSFTLRRLTIGDLVVLGLNIRMASTTFL